MTYLFTHNDLDGVGCAVIARLGIPQPLSITYCSYGSVDHEICDLLDKLTTPAEIYISDISVKEETARRLDEYLDRSEGGSVRLFDHHPVKVSRPWMTVDTSPMECGTSLLAKALIPNPSPAVSAFVDAVCSFDTWRFEKGIRAFPERLNALHDILGHHGFEELVLEALNADEPFSIPYLFELAVQNSFLERERYFQAKEQAMITTTFSGYRAGVVFAERDISLLADTIFKDHPELDIVAVCYMPAGVSLRTRREDINLTEICRIRGGGGGHRKAAAFLLESGTVEKAVDIIFGEESRTDGR